MLQRVLLAVFASVLAACGQPSRPPSAAPDAAAQGAGDAGPTACYEPSITGNVMPGTADLEACAIWNNVANMTGTVTLTRTGDDLTMAFSTGLTFTGTITGTDVTLTSSALHDFTDGCTWRATETLDGTLDPATCVMTLGYDYVETVEVSNGACAQPCTGTADFTLSITPIL